MTSTLIGLPFNLRTGLSLKLTVGNSDGRAYLRVDGMSPDADIIIPDGHEVDVTLSAASDVGNLAITRSPRWVEPA
jgi:hypothetical protein